MTTTRSGRTTSDYNTFVGKRKRAARTQEETKEGEVAGHKVLDNLSYDSKKVTGYVGLKNQGATSYMNSRLQTLYHIPSFRKAVLHMSMTDIQRNFKGYLTTKLQRLFGELQHSDTSVATEEFTDSFEWGSCDPLRKHDVHELNKVLSEKLEDVMKGTVAEGFTQGLFGGHHMTYIKCINVDITSTITRSFYDLQLDVKGCRDVYASFDKYVEVKTLEDDNKYRTEEHGLQDAKKGVLFIDFPPVLQLQLKRFEYDCIHDETVKINDPYEFPLELDLDRDNGRYLSPDADRSVRNLYTLHSVLVHSGVGHCYAFIRPALTEQWYKFDDERVTKEDVRRALDERYGGKEVEELPQANPGSFESTNTYMLVYIRESDKDKIMCGDNDNEHIAECIRPANFNAQRLRLIFDPINQSVDAMIDLLNQNPELLLSMASEEKKKELKSLLNKFTIAQKGTSEWLQKYMADPNFFFRA